MVYFDGLTADGQRPESSVNSDFPIWQVGSYIPGVSVTVTGEVERVTYENEETSFRVLRVGRLSGDTQSLPAQVRKNGSIAVIGTFQAVGPGMQVRVTGNLVLDPRHGEQLRADVLVPIEPNTLTGLEKYLGSGRIPGVGPALAKRIVKAFGLETLDVLDHKSARLAEVPGIGKKKIEEIRRNWAAQRALSSVLVLLQSHGASPNLAMRIWKHYGDRAAGVVQRSPYRLALDMRGVGFKTADRLAASLGISHDHPERCQAGVVHGLEELAESGHVFAPRPLLVERVAALLGVDAPHVEAAIDALWASGRLVIERDGVYLSWLHAAERDVAEAIQRLRAQQVKPIPNVKQALEAYERARKIELAPDQRRAVETAAVEAMTIITGGPGVGKTTIVRAVLSVFEGRKLVVRLAAPTGRAAKRLNESTGHEASTLHRLLEMDPRTGSFQRSRENPIDADVLIVDEASMIDLELMQGIMNALATGTRLVIVGDADQLPSVGPGAVLRDLIASDVIPTVRLTRIFRQGEASGIVENAHRILRGEMPESASADDARGDFFIISRQNPEDAAQVVRELVSSRIPRKFGFAPERDVQVLTPMHKGAAGTQALNELLQQTLNPLGPALEVRGQKLRAGDKVLQTRNDYEHDVFNGDVGFISTVSTEERSLNVRFDGSSVDYEESELDALSLAYAMSVHKSQGSEYPAVVLTLLTAHFVMLSRNLLYTAVTRARSLCVLVADPRALRLAVSETRKEERMTRLAERLVTLARSE